MHKPLALLSAAVLLALVACRAPTTSVAAGGPILRTTTVDLPTSYRFEPARIEVGAGQAVTWTNHDNFTHSVQVDGQSEVHMLRPGEAVQIAFNTPGDYAYVCTLHTQNMRGSVVVR